MCFGYDRMIGIVSNTEIIPLQCKDKNCYSLSIDVMDYHGKQCKYQINNYSSYEKAKANIIDYSNISKIKLLKPLNSNECIKYDIPQKIWVTDLYLTIAIFCIIVIIYRRIITIQYMIKIGYIDITHKFVKDIVTFSELLDIFNKEMSRKILDID